MRDNTKDFDKAESNIAVNDDGSLALLRGRIDMESSPAVRERLLALLQVPDRKILSIDFSAVTHIDSSGIATLIEALRIARANKTKLSLQGLHDPLLQFFECTGILALFNGSVGTITPCGAKGV